MRPGRCRVVVTPETLDKLRARTDITVDDEDKPWELGFTYETHSGAIMHSPEKRVVGVESDLLPEGDHWHLNVVLEKDGSIKFVKDEDT